MNPRCPYCGGAAPRCFRTKDFNRRISSALFTYFRCATCGLLFLDPVPENLGVFYPKGYHRMPAHIGDLDTLAPGEKYKVDLVSRFVPIGRLLEIGPSYGGFLYAARQAGYTVEGIEMDEDCCRFLTEFASIPTIQGTDVVAALRCSAPYDIITLWHVVEHIPSPWITVRAAMEAIRPGGILVIATPSPESFQFRIFGRRWTHIDAPRHITLLPPSLLESIGKSAGFEVVELSGSDPGTLYWNEFGWRESLANLSSMPALKRASRLFGSALSIALGPIERRIRWSSSYTIVLRNPVVSPGITTRDKNRQMAS